MEMNRKLMKQILFLITCAILIYLGLSNLSQVTVFLRGLVGLFAPFLLGLCIAFVLNAPLRLFENRIFARFKKGRVWNRLRRPVCIVLSIFVVFALLLFVIMLVIPEIIRTLGMLASSAPAFVADVQAKLDEWGATFSAESLAALNINWSSMLESAVDFLRSGAGDFVNATVGVTTSIFNGMLNFILGLIFSIYVLVQKEALTRQVKKALYAYLPERAAKKIIAVGSLSNTTFSNFVNGQCVEAVIIGALCFLGMTILRLPYALMISVLVGFTALIPVFGAFIGTAVGMLLILTVSPIQSLWFLIFVVILQQVEGNLIYPHVVGSSVGLPGIWVMVAVTIGGSAMGILGMLLSVPVCSVAYSLLRDSINHRLQVRKKTLA